MQDPGYLLPRMLLLGSWVDEGKKKKKRREGRGFE
jgi:hypothetical protein